MTRLAITGSSGLIGSALVHALRARGDEVVRLVRRAPTTSDEVSWDPASRHLDESVLEGVDAVVNLAGAGVGDKRWSAAHKRQILLSRTDATHAVATAIAAGGRPIRLVSGSAVGLYGDRGAEEITETSSPGSTFLADVVRAWEAAAAPAVEAGASVAFARTGIVLARDGGAAAPLVRLARFGLAGPLGPGTQYWPWITLVDEVAALIHLVDRPDIVGPVNLVTASDRQRDLASALGRALGRPAIMPAPAFVLRAIVGEFAGEILGGQRIVGEVLRAGGYQPQHGDLDAAARWLVG
jgi:uncharacterized protein